ncbi:DinB family protein [Brevibacillus panacihumi]
MMFTKVADFAAEWEQESAITVKLLEALTDEALNQRVAEGHWTLGEIAWHLVQSINYMSSMGLSFPAPQAEQPTSAAAIAAEYRAISREMLNAVMTQWDDASLLEVKEIAGGQWRNGDSLRLTITHQAHHRGQMTVLMRQAGMKEIPSIFG